MSIEINTVIYTKLKSVAWKDTSLDNIVFDYLTVIRRKKSWWLVGDKNKHPGTSLIFAWGEVQTGPTQHIVNMIK